MKVSVIIPVYNAEKYLKRCLDSVISQTYCNWEVIAIDDGSKDNSYSILLGYAVKDTRFKVFTQENKGPGYTRNIGMSISSGDYIVFIDSDDYIDENYFNQLIECIRANNSDVVFIDVIQETPEGRLIKPEIMSKYRRFSKETIIRHQMTGKLPWGGCRKAVRAKLLADNKINFSKDVVGEEAIFSFRILYHADKIDFINKPYYHYVNHPNSQSKKGDTNPYGPICRKLEKHLREIGEYENFKDTIYSFAFTAFVLNVYKLTLKYPFLETYKRSKIAFNQFNNDYGFSLDVDSLEIRARCVFYLARLGSVLPIVIVAKIKSLL